MLVRDMLRAVLVTVWATKLADRRFLILRGTIGVAALLAEHLPQVIVDSFVRPPARKPGATAGRFQARMAGEGSVILT
jgi:hypothetical protein